MAITHVNNDSAQGDITHSPLLYNLSNPVSAGDLLVIGIAWTPTTSSVTSVVFSPSGTIATASSIGQKNNGTSIAGEIFFVQNCVGGDTSFTVTLSSVTTMGIVFMEFSGAALSGGEDGTGSGTGTGNSLSTSANVVSAGLTNVAVGFGISADTLNVWENGTGFTLSSEGSGTPWMSGEWRIFTSAINQTVTMSFAPSASNPWIMLADTFQVYTPPVATSSVPLTSLFSFLGLQPPH